MHNGQVNNEIHLSSATTKAAVIGCKTGGALSRTHHHFVNLFFQKSTINLGDLNLRGPLQQFGRYNIKAVLFWINLRFSLALAKIRVQITLGLNKFDNIKLRVRN